MDRNKKKTFSGVDKIPTGQASGQLTEGCLLLEGGAFRGVFTSGVLDCLMVQNLNLSAAVGVSAGALNAYNYVAGAIGRSARVNLLYRHDTRWVGRKALRKNRGIIGFDFLYGNLSQVFPINRESMLHSSQRLVVVATNCLTGEAEFFEKDCGSLEQAVRASASMPIVSAMVPINGKPYLDGGCANRLPLDWVLSQGYQKLIVVRTRPRDYRKKEKPLNSTIRRLYKNYPDFLKALEQSARLYNHTCDQLERMEREGKIKVIYPSGDLHVSRLEGDMEKLGALYFEGYEMTQARLKEIRSYLLSPSVTPSPDPAYSR